MPRGIPTKETAAIGQRIRDARRRAGFDTTRAASEQTSFTRQALVNWELGCNEPPGKALREMGALYDCSIDWMLTGELTIRVRQPAALCNLLDIF